MKKEIKLSTFFEWYFSDENNEGISITYWDRINKEMYHQINILFTNCKVVPKRLVEGDEDLCGDYIVNQEVILVKDRKKFQYQLTTNTIWTSFDNGFVYADNIEEARKLAEKELSYNFKKANEILNSCDPTIGFKIEMDLSQIELKEIYTTPTMQCQNTHTFDKVKEVIQILNTLDNGDSVDGETMEYILEQVGMKNQILKQLVNGM